MVDDHHCGMSTGVRKVGDAELREALKNLPGWSLQDGKLRTVYKFADFSQAWAFMTRCALAAEKIDHHPDWRNIYNSVEISLWTHDCGAVTEKDLALAKQIAFFAADKV